MKKQKISKKLNLNKITITNLGIEQKRAIRGGVNNDPNNTGTVVGPASNDIGRAICQWSGGSTCEKEIGCSTPLPYTQPVSNCGLLACDPPDQPYNPYSEGCL